MPLHIRPALAAIAGLLCLAATVGQEPAASPKPDPAAARAVRAAPHHIKDLEMSLVRIEPGEFIMGSDVSEAHREDDEHAHRVAITRPFYIQSTEVTQSQWKAIMGENPSYFKGDNLPVDNVSWDDAMAFCKKLGEREKRKFRLPTEAEWEFAARAGKDGPVAGSGKLPDMAWFADNSGAAAIDAANLWDNEPGNYFNKLLANKCGSHSVATRKANDWGIYDMQGNVVEWVADWYAADYFRNSPKSDPTGPEKSTLNSRLLRGGSWGSDVRHCRLADRDWNEPGKRSPSYGFRVVMDPQ
jgi:formylglycine-generating enzyme required for sulfatase activity